MEALLDLVDVRDISSTSATETLTGLSSVGGRFSSDLAAGLLLSPTPAPTARA